MTAVGARGVGETRPIPAPSPASSAPPPSVVLETLEALYGVLCRTDLEVGAEERRAVVKVLAGIRSLAGWHEKRERARLALE